MNRHTRPPIRLFATGLWAALSTVVHATCPSWPTAERFVYQAGGAEVRDSRTGLVWARCSVGQTWVGTDCAGTVSFLTHEAALAYANTQTGWRLPSRRELSSLADKGCVSPAIDRTAFPSTATSVYWSTSPFVGNANGAWGVYFNSGLVLDYSRDLNAAVRLVRVTQ